MMNERRVNYDDLQGKLQTGDLLFCHGIFPEALQIEAIERSPWSHVGMVVKLPGVEELLLWESTTMQTLPDVELKRLKKAGPMLVSLRERIATDVSGGHDALFAFRLLEAQRSDGLTVKLKQFIEEVHQASFPSMERMALEYLEGKLHIQAGGSSLFCSELVAETYMHLGIMDRSHPSNSYQPADFSNRTDLPLCSGCKLSDELLLLTDV
ncbi:hypothetical protein SAMN04487970_101993 [Paenibacillus tianmuensis]|uniref:Permuted papain-like amidase enzyme, YaeF/YiiX, C92 family n=1 Tax=Paenibacillus tianmuensis TaxID=624147 RepID=A0A1G4RVC4_9BACL|nr:hypothetical protein [Paenibacillus tianmuensis]SCW60671.1 hypothetical protein SAMN04487970_101993 [Paenibacillus tianmuensis]